MEHRSPIRRDRLSVVNHRYEAGSVLLVVVLLVALLAAVVMGHLQVNIEEIQLMQNHVGGAEALATAEAGLNDALAQLRQDPGWRAGYADKPFGVGSYTVVVDGSTVTATAATSRGFVAKIQAEITRGADDSSSVVQVSEWRINK
jgi:Tfp pilus assembly protein PilX